MITDIEDMGYAGTEILLKNDQEPAIIELQPKIMAARSAEMVSFKVRNCS